MSQNSASNPAPEQRRPWLRAMYEAKRQRTVDLVKATVDRLVEEEEPVTIEAICRLSRELDPKGKGIQKAGVLGNAEAHAYYRQHSTSYRAQHTWKDRQPPRPPASTSPPRIKLDRDVVRVRRRYRLLNKAVLVERLLATEQAYAEAQQQLARLQFELAEVKQKLQEAILQPAPPLGSNRRPN